MLGGKIRFEGLRGVGTVELDLMPNQRVYTLIGTNGVGKTKTLEALFQVLFLQNPAVPPVFNKNDLVFRSVGTPDDRLNNQPVIFLGAQNRSLLSAQAYTPELLGSFAQRQENYLHGVLQGMADPEQFSGLNMGDNLNAWFVKIAQSATPFQKAEDNRLVEINTVLGLMHEIDPRIDPKFLEISGDGRVSLLVDGQKRELAQLSTGYASILKMLQAIVSGYGYFTNEQQLQQVRGIVLIDEIESHLHLSWQAGIIPLLKRLFPNTTFVITTHSPLVLAQLNTGEAYRLARDQDGVVRTHPINAPNKHVLADVLQEAFEVDINKVRQDSQSDEEKMAAKQALLKFLESEWEAKA